MTPTISSPKVNYVPHAYDYLNYGPVGVFCGRLCHLLSGKLPSNPHNYHQLNFSDWMDKTGLKKGFKDPDTLRVDDVQGARMLSQLIKRKVIIKTTEELGYYKSLYCKPKLFDLKFFVKSVFKDTIVASLAISTMYLLTSFSANIGYISLGFALVVGLVKGFVKHYNAKVFDGVKNDTLKLCFIESFGEVATAAFVLMVGGLYIPFKAIFKVMTKTLVNILMTRRDVSFVTKRELVINSTKAFFKGCMKSLLRSQTCYKRLASVGGVMIGSAVINILWAHCFV